MTAGLEPRRDTSFQSTSVPAALAKASTATRQDLFKLRIPFSTNAEDVYQNPFRAKRLATFLGLVDNVLRDKSACRVIDLGGAGHYWNGLRHIWSNRNVEITIVNVGPPTEADASYNYIQGDARRLPEIANNMFDIVHSNSVLEHVGSWRDKLCMAGEVRRLAKSYFVQTPNYWFPIEPHMRSLFIHWLPRPIQRKIVSLRSCGFYGKASTMDQAQDILSDAEMLDHAEMAALFPDARILPERFGLLNKSWIAIR